MELPRLRGRGEQGHIVTHALPLSTPYTVPVLDRTKISRNLSPSQPPVSIASQ